MGLLGLIAVCTDLGPLVASVDEAGALQGTVGPRLSVTGTTDALEVRAGGTLVFEGALGGLHPVRVREPQGTVEAHARAVGVLLRCGSGGPDAVRVGLWPERVPLSLGRRATWSSPTEVRVRGPGGAATTYLALPMDRALAASVAAELDAALPDARRGVDWRDGVALVGWSWDPEQWVPAGVAPTPGEAPVLGLFDLTVAGAPRSGAPALGPGAELAGLLDEVRASAGLPRLGWDEGLALAALQHAAHVVHEGRFPAGHGQDADSPLFLGETPSERGGAVEVLLSSYPARSPREALDLWLAAPFHRVPLLHPNARRIGIAGIGGVWVAEVEIEEGPARFAWPASGQQVDTTFVGREDPDPLPLVKYPDRVWPVGFPVTLWTSERVTSSSMRCGAEELAHWVVRAPLGGPDDSRHLVPKAPLPQGASCSWSVETAGGSWEGEFGTRRSSSEPEVVLPEAVARVVARANAQRVEPLRATTEAAALARLMSARTRAMEAGLAPSRVRNLQALPREGDDAPAQLCVRPSEDFDLDEVLLDPRYATVGADARATTVTWRGGPSLRSPRTCLWLFSR